MCKHITRLLPFCLLHPIVFMACGNYVEQEPAHPPKVSVAEVKLTTLYGGLSYSAKITEKSRVEISFMSSGRVNNVFVKEGNYIKAGDLLASIDPFKYKYELDAANAEQEKAQDLLDRYAKLYAKGSLPEKDYVTAKLQLQQAEATAKTAQLNMANTKVAAPSTGTITACIEKGTYVSPGAPAFTLINTDQVYANISVPEGEIGRISVGQACKVTIPTVDKELPATITIVNPEADAASSTYTVKIMLDNPARKLLPGMLANVSISTSGPRNVIAIPSGALIKGINGNNFVYTLTPDNKAQRADVQVGEHTDSTVVITSGLRPGSRVITAGQQSLNEGDPVSL